MIKYGGWFAATLVTLFWVANSAQATTACVDPSGGGDGECYGNVYSALFDLYFGDTVRVRPGVYKDTLQIPPLKTGVRIIGSAGVVFDARSDGIPGFQNPNCPNNTNGGCQGSIHPQWTTCVPNDTQVWLDPKPCPTCPGDTIPNPNCNIPCQPNAGWPTKVCLNEDVAVHIFTSDVQLVGLTFLGGISHGVFVEPGNDNTRLVNVKVIHPNGEGVRALGSDGTTLIDVEVIGALGGVNLDGAGLVTDRLTIEGSDGPGVVLVGDNVVMSQSKISRVVNGEGIFVTGDGTVIDGVVVEDVDSTAIQVVGNDAVVVRSAIESAGGGVSVVGDSPWVSWNRVSQVAGGNPGIAVTCSTCADGVVNYNRVEGTVGESAGFVIAAAGAGLLVEANRAKNVADRGFDLSGSSGVELLNNRSDKVGVVGEACFQIEGPNHVVTSNFASNCAGNGFTFGLGSNVAAEYNTAILTGGDGFEVSEGSSGASLRLNVAFWNRFYGFEVADGSPPATGTTLDWNTARANGFADLCEEGSGTVLLSNNMFGSEEYLAQDAVRDCVQ